MNEGNLIPFTSDQSREEAVRNGRAGGIASGKARRRKRNLREAVDAIMSMPVRPGELQDMAGIDTFQDLQAANLTVSESIALRIVMDALSDEARLSDRLRAVRVLAELSPSQSEAVAVRTVHDITFDEAMRWIAQQREADGE